MRRHALGLSLALMGAAFIAGCTLLVSFDDKPIATLAEASAPRSDSGNGGPADPVDVPDTSAPNPTDTFPPACATDIALTDVQCGGATLPTCAKGSNRIVYPAGVDTANDLVTCTGGVPTCIQHCPAGCAVMPNGFPDQCNDCTNRNDGYYCGKDFRGWAPKDDDVAVECKGEQPVMGHICGAGRCFSTCPDGKLAPACCN